MKPAARITELKRSNQAHLRLLVPVEHGVDGLGQIGAAGFVDAASVNPAVINALATSFAASGGDLVVACLCCSLTLTKLPESHLLTSPCMRQDSVSRNGAEKLF